MSPTPAARKGRGARTDATGRFEPVIHEDFDDGWTSDDDTPAPWRTTLTPEHARKIITTNTSPDIGFDRSINPYKGCEHGCVYSPVRTGLDAGPAYAHLGFSPRLPEAGRRHLQPFATRRLEPFIKPVRLAL